MASIIGAAIAFAIAGAVTNEVVKRVEPNPQTKYSHARDEEYDNYRSARDAYENKLRLYQEGKIKRREDKSNADAVFISNDHLMAKYKGEYVLSHSPPRLSDYVTEPRKSGSNVWVPLSIGVGATVVGGMTLYAIERNGK